MYYNIIGVDFIDQVALRKSIVTKKLNFLFSIVGFTPARESGTTFNIFVFQIA